MSKNMLIRLDMDRYDRLQTGMARIRASLGNLIDPTKNSTYMRLWRELESLKNRHGGHAPTLNQTGGHVPKENEEI